MYLDFNQVKIWGSETPPKWRSKIDQNGDPKAINMGIQKSIKIGTQNRDSEDPKSEEF